MSEDAERAEQPLSPWWRRAVIITVVIGFAILIAVSVGAYRTGPPIPQKVVGPDGKVLFTGEDVQAGQQVFLKHALMQNGSIWGHGAYLGPDFSAAYLHQLAVRAQAMLAKRIFGRAGEDLSAPQRAALNAEVHQLLKENRYDPQSGTLRFTEPEAASYREQLSDWEAYFTQPERNRGLPARYISDPKEIKQLTSFFAWAAWASVANRPGKDHTYTNNFPYDPLAGNAPSTDAVLWSALSLIPLFGGTALVLFAFGRFNFLGWRRRGDHAHPEALLGQPTASQRATLKFFALATLLFLAQVLVGGATAHSVVDPKSFFGIDLSGLLPSNILRTWHLQLAILWIATAYVGGGLLLGSVLGGREAKRQVLGINALFAALGLVVFGSLLGEFAGVHQWLRSAWYWLGLQGWEYLDLGRLWQVLLAGGMIIWVVLLVRAVGPMRRDAQQGELCWLFLIAASAIPLFYLPAFLFKDTTHFTVVDTWRFWIIHLWVEGFFEFLVTVLVAALFYKLGMVSRQTATRVIYLDAILFLGAGIVGTGHHWYFTGQSSFSMALAACFSAMEPVPLILLTLDAWDFISLARSRCTACGEEIRFAHKWTFYYLMAVGFWNFVGAGVFGFLINLPIVSYFEVGTTLTLNHGHAAMMGVFGMMALALAVFAIRHASTDAQWAKVEKLVRVSFWGTNIGLALMVAVDLFPVGVLQLRDVLQNGYWHARSPEFLDLSFIRLLGWARLPADAVFILLGALPIAAAAAMTAWRAGRRHKHPPG